MSAFAIGIALTFWESFKKYIIIGGAVLAFILTVWFKGYSSANNKWKERQKKATVQAIEKRKEINAKVRDMDDARLDSQLDKWMRD